MFVRVRIASCCRPAAVVVVTAWLLQEAAVVTNVAILLPQNIRVLSPPSESVLSLYPQRALAEAGHYHCLAVAPPSLIGNVAAPALIGDRSAERERERERETETETETERERERDREGGADRMVALI